MAGGGLATADAGPDVRRGDGDRCGAEPAAEACVPAGAHHGQSAAPFRIKRAGHARHVPLHAQSDVSGPGNDPHWRNVVPAEHDRVAGCAVVRALHHLVADHAGRAGVAGPLPRRVSDVPPTCAALAVAGFTRYREIWHFTAAE